MNNKKTGYLHQKYWHPKNYTDSMHIPAINDFIPKYAEKAKQIEKPDWYAKYAGLYFTYDGEAYALYPGDINTSAEIFAILEDDFADDLYNIGAYDIYCAGMID